MKSFKQLAIIGSTASGKTALSIEVAKDINAHILSLDSLALYKDIDIVSAKPTPKERAGVKHFGIDLIYPDEEFNVVTFIELYNEVYKECIKDGKNLIIVGGTSFYLKMLIDGISKLPTISQQSKEKSIEYLQDTQKAYKFISDIDKSYMKNIDSKDRYRIEKALNIYFETGLTPSEYFRKNPPKPTIIQPLPIYQIVWDREILRKRISLRTQMMYSDGLIDEICYLEKRYTRKPNSMKSIGIKETLAYLDGIYDKKMLIEKITTNTARLAKRQTTYNNSQFKNVTKGNVKELKEILIK